MLDGANRSMWDVVVFVTRMGIPIANGARIANKAMGQSSFLASQRVASTMIVIKSVISSCCSGILGLCGSWCAPDNTRVLDRF
jgi:hypothetical protein